MAGDTASSTHPPLPPTTEEDRSVWLRLLRSRRVGPSTFWRLMAEHGSARAALLALPEVARAAGVTDYEICPEGVVQAELRAGRAAGARLVALPDPAYPPALRDLPDAPPLLWVRGREALVHRPLLALVGARNASSLGLRMARRLAADLTEAGFVVVSGLARGIDAATHEAALPGGTLAVLAGGVDVVYPPENAALAARIASDGLLVSEQPVGLQPQARHFPARNRIVSGMSRAVIIVEAAAKSGSLITARTALDQGREVLAVPGHPFDARAAGANLLIRDGATLVRDAADVIEAIGPAEDPEAVASVEVAAGRAALRNEGRAPATPPIRPAPPPAARPLREVAALHREILDRLGPSPLAEDQLLRDLAADSGQLAPALLDLELEGRIQRQPGGLLARLN